MTNFEKIKVMSLDEMAEFVRGRWGCAVCIYSKLPNAKKAKYCLAHDEPSGCKRGIRAWLESEVDNDKT